MSEHEIDIYEPTEFADPIEDEIVTWRVTNCRSCGRRIRQVGGFPDSPWRHLVMGQVYCWRRVRPLPLLIDGESPADPVSEPTERN